MNHAFSSLTLVYCQVTATPTGALSSLQLDKVKEQVKARFVPAAQNERVFRSDAGTIPLPSATVGGREDPFLQKEARPQDTPITRGVKKGHIQGQEPRPFLQPFLCRTMSCHDLLLLWPDNQMIRLRQELPPQNQKYLCERRQGPETRHPPFLPGPLPSLPEVVPEQEHRTSGHG